MEIKWNIEPYYRAHGSVAGLPDEAANFLGSKPVMEGRCDWSMLQLMVSEAALGNQLNYLEKDCKRHLPC